MTSSVALYSLLTQFVLGQDTIPDPSRSTSPPRTQNPGAVDRFFPNQPSNQGSNQTNDPLTEALGTNIPTPARAALDQLRAMHLGERLYFYLSDDASNGDSIYLLPDNRILRLAPNPHDLRIYTYNSTTRSWTDLGSRTSHPTNPPHTDAHIASGIRAIIASRAERPWVSPPIRTLLNQVNATAYSHPAGVWRYYGPTYPNQHGDFLYVTPQAITLPGGTNIPAGSLLALSAERNDPRVWVYSSRGWDLVGERTGDTHSVNHIQQGIRAILAARQATSWQSIADRTGILGNYLGDRTFLYNGNINDSRNDSVYALRNGDLLMLSATPTSMTLWRYNLTIGRWEQIGTRNSSDQAQLNPAFRSVYSIDDINDGIRLILASRRRRGVFQVPATTTTTSSSTSRSVRPEDWRRLGIDPDTLRPIPGHYLNRMP